MSDRFRTAYLQLVEESRPDEPRRPGCGAFEPALSCANDVAIRVKRLS